MPAVECTNILEDIEDLFRNAENDSSLNARESSRDYIYPKVRKSATSQAAGGLPVVADSIIPGTHSIYVKTWGCTHNTSDSEYMAGQLSAYGYQIVEDKNKADLWLLNSCTVKSPAEDHFRNEIQAGQKLGKHLVLAGCVAQSVPTANYLKGLSIIGVQQIDRVVEVVEETLKGHSVRLLGKKKQDGRKTGGAALTLPKIRRNALIEIIAISTGCLNHCTYCKTKHARGELGSYPVEDIVERARQAFQEGVVELWITSEDTGAYGRDIGSSLPQLLWKVIEVIPTGCMLRLGMTNPPYILEHLEEMAKILNHPKVYSFLHIPVQSGSDPILADMKREYCRSDFENVVDFLKERVPNITIATDVICGFPTETDTDFQETLDLIEKYKFPSLFINQFFPRPGTPAAKMTKIPTREVKKRTKKVSELFASYFPYSHKVGEIQDVLVTEVSTDKEFYIGHNKFYEQVLVPKVDSYLGKWAKVIIVTTGKHYLMGKLVSNDALTNPDVSSPLPQGTLSGTIRGISKSEENKPNRKHLNTDMILASLLLTIFISWLVYKVSVFYS